MDVRVEELAELPKLPEVANVNTSYTGRWSEKIASLNLTSNDRVELIYDELVGSPVRFTIGQPKDPKWKDDVDTDGGRIVDVGTPFLLTRDWSNILEMALSRDKIAQDNWDREEKKWKLGVGVGVGVGVPVLMIASYVLGHHSRKKKNPEAVMLKAVNNKGL